MKAEKQPLPVVPTEGSKQERDGGNNPTENHTIREMQMGKSLYIVQSHHSGNETLDDKIERLVLRSLQYEGSGADDQKGIRAIPFSHGRVTHYLLLPNSGTLKSADLLLGKDGG
ncbi:MAG: hypothetical protein K0Q73_6566 [Paenibacillus sp.]|nr:hypothetical protein [Paenibacillus sp.]